LNSDRHSADYQDLQQACKPPNLNSKPIINLLTAGNTEAIVKFFSEKFVQPISCLYICNQTVANVDI
jgi:hypothetical protein